MSEYRLVMKGVVKTFPGVKALDHAQLELRPGKVMALMGENGAGKSTLMKCMFGIYKMDEGEIEYEGQKVTIPNPLEALNRGIAMVHQELQPIPARTVAENIWLGRYPTKKAGPITIVDHAKMYKDTDDLLKKLKLDINSHAKLGSLSIAQMQMVEIAKAVSANCKVLILDEPTNGLDPIGIAEVRNFIKDLSTEHGKTILISSHILSEIELLADDIGIIDHGILLEESSMDELQRKNSKYILLQVSEVSKALLILERQFGVKDYSVQDEQTLRLYDTTLDMAAINKALVTQEVSVISSGLCNDTLEDYFKKITGGEGIA